MTASKHAAHAEAEECLRSGRFLASAGRAPLWIGLVVFFVVFAYSWFGDHGPYVFDDAGICLRYAERIAGGRGFNYNDGEAVNGASNPVFVLTEAALLRLGLTPERTILLIASACIAATAGVLFSTFALYYSLGAAFFSVLALLAFPVPFESIVDGMETPIVMLLAALLFRSLHDDSFLFPGLVLGALVANKLDGALAATAYAAVFLVVRRHLPWRTAGIALLAALPVFVVLLASFGSIIPNSMMVKLLVDSRARAMDHLWMHKMLSGGRFSIPYWGAWLSLLWMPLARNRAGSIAIAVTQVWFVFHMLAYSVINLGWPSPWYSAVPTIHSVILATFVIHVVSSTVVVRSHPLRLDWDPSNPPRRMWPVSMAFLAVFGWHGFPLLSSRLRHPSAPHLVSHYTTLDLGREAAGVWLRKHTTGTELFATFEGLPAYEYGGPCYDFSLLNSVKDEARQRSAVYQLDGPAPIKGDALPMIEPKTGRRLVATFRYDAADNFYLLYAKPESQIYSNGARHFFLPTPALWVGAPGSRPPQRAVQDGNTWSLPATARARFLVRSPLPPTVLFTLAIHRGRNLPAVAGDLVRLNVRSDGVVLASAVIAAGQAPARERATAPRTSETGEYTFEIESRYTGSEDSEELSVELSEVLVRCGEPLEATDFKLSIPRSRSRIDYVADWGLPWNVVGW